MQANKHDTSKDFDLSIGYDMDGWSLELDFDFASLNQTEPGKTNEDG